MFIDYIDILNETISLVPRRSGRNSILLFEVSNLLQSVKWYLINSIFAYCNLSLTSNIALSFHIAFIDKCSHLRKSYTTNIYIFI